MEDRLILCRTGGFHERFDISYFLEDVLKITDRYYSPKQNNNNKESSKVFYYIRYFWAEMFLWWGAKKIFQGHLSIAKKVWKTLYRHGLLLSSILYSIIHFPSFLIKRWKSRANV
jgi:hypothetical protein